MRNPGGQSKQSAMRRVLIWVALAALVLFAAGVLLRWWSERLPRIDPDDPAQVALGRAIYAAQCARCHGANLEGQPDWRSRQANNRLPAPPHDQTGHSWHHPDKLLFGMTKYGLGPYAPAGYESDMPAFDEILSDEEIAAALAYIKSRWPAEVRANQDRIGGQMPAQQ